MPVIPATESGDDAFSIGDWKEFLAAADPAGADVLSIDSGDATLTGYIAANKTRSALNFFLGYSYVTLRGTPGSPGYARLLNRELPARHPVFPYLYVKSVQFHRHNPCANPAMPADAPYVDAVDIADGPKIVKTSRYLTQWLTLHFAPRPYDLLEDADTTYEYERFCQIWAKTEPELSTISASNAKYLTFVEGDPKDKEFPGEISEYRHTTAHTILWENVPEEYVADDSGFYTKLIQPVGCVNHDTFLGIPRGCALCLPPRFRRYTQPVRTTDASKLFAVDIEINLSVFDPEPAVGYDNSYYRGWNLMPWVNGGNEGPDAGGVGWYSVWRPDGSAFLPSADFTKMFEGWDT